jgi:hypothetical protein
MSNRGLLRESSKSASVSELLELSKDAIAPKGDGVSKSDVMQATSMTSGQWSLAIKALLADGSVTQTGERRGARYHLAEGEG